MGQPAVGTAFGASLGLMATTLLLVGVLAPGTTAGVAIALATGAVGDLMLRRLGCEQGIRWGVGLVAPMMAALLLGSLVLVPVDTLVVVSLTVGAVIASAAGAGRRWVAAAVTLGVPAFVVTGVVVGAGAWSVDEPGAADSRMIAGNGVVVGVDTHAFLIQQGDVILRNDKLTAVADFLDSPDPAAPYRRTAAGALMKIHESYLWRVQLGSRDADRVLKKDLMPDHFLNWWTHSGKGLIAGTSAATWAEQQFAQAVQSWRGGDKSTAMYHLGAATHLVDDGCAPPHASQYVPDHRAYEDWVEANQSRYAITSGGIYRADFRVHTGHGGEEWSSAHTRGWVDECAHRAAELVINTAQPPPDDPADTTVYADTMDHFRDAQRLTAGYLAFFFESVAGP